MHVAVIKSHQNGKTYTSTLLRQSYRDHNNRVQKRTLANLSHLPPHTIPLLRGALAGKQYAEVGDILGDPVRSRLHGAVQAVRTAMNAIGLPRLVCWVPECSGLRRRVCPTFPAGIFFSEPGTIRDKVSSPSRVFQVATTLSGQEQYQAAVSGAGRPRPAAFACLLPFPAGGTPQTA